MIYKVFHFKSLKIVLGKTGDQYIGYSVDTKYPEYSRAIIRGSEKEVVEICIYLYKSRLLTAYYCENYEWPACEGIDHNRLDEEVNDWVDYVLNRYLLERFDMYFEYKHRVVNYSYIASDGTPCSLDDYMEDGITIKYW